MSQFVEYPLPRGWGWGTIEELASYVQRGKSPEYTVRSDLPVVNQKCVRWHGIEPQHLKFIDPSQWPAWSSERTLRDGDVLWNSTGTGTIGRAAIYRPLQGFGRVVADSHVTIVRVRLGLPEYLHAWIRSPVIQGRIEGMQSGSTNQVELGRSEVLSTRVPVAPLNEQRRIVAKLEALQARGRRAREALDAVPPLLEKLRQSILAAGFRGDLTKEWRAKHKDVEPASKLLERIRAERRKKWEEGELAKMKAKGKVPKGDEWKAKYKEPEAVDAEGLPELPEGWVWASLDELAHVGTGATPKRGEERYYSGGTIAWVTSGALNDEAVLEATEFVTARAVAETNLTIYPPGTLLLAMYGEGKTRGMVAELRIEAATNQAIAAICLQGAAAKTKGLVRLALAQNYAKIRSVSKGGVQPNLNLQKVRALAVPLCPSEEAPVLERIVATAVARARALSTDVRNQAAALNTLNECILAKAFRGELVPQDQNDEPAEVMLAGVRGANGAATNGVKDSTSKRRGD